MDFDLRPLAWFFAIVGLIGGGILLKLVELIVEHVRVYWK
jgi:hypothetical protein